MQLDRLGVLHQSKEGQSSGLAAPQFPGGFYLDTCQRRIWIFQDEIKHYAPYMEGVRPGFDFFHGVNAYLFLLQVATGLQSRVQGETDIFGQIKDAWKKLEEDRPLQAKKLEWVFQRLFEDTKEIRAQFLHQVGGQSYGTLVRKILKDQGFGTEDTVLVSGAGLLGKSVAQLLLDSKVVLQNRSKEALLALQAELLKNSKTRVTAAIDDVSEINAFLTADAIVVCTPAIAEKDRARIELIRSRNDSPIVIHLGVRDSDAGEWGTLSKFFTLDDIFDLQKVQNEFRRVQIERALHACEERARLRSLGGSLSVPHGWEDLALFA